MGEDVREHEPRQEVIHLVEPMSMPSDGGAKDVEEREHDCALMARGSDDCRRSRAT